MHFTSETMSHILLICLKLFFNRYYIQKYTNVDKKKACTSAECMRKPYKR